MKHRVDRPSLPVPCIAGLLLMLSHAQALAYVECTVTPQKYYIGANGYRSVSWVEGGVAVVDGNPAGARSVLATVHLAIASGRQWTARCADGMASTDKQTLQGLWLAD